MKRFLLCSLLTAHCLFGLSACVSRPAATPGATPDAKALTAPSIVQKVMDAALPATLTGYAKFTVENQYFDIIVEGDGLKRTPDGWEFTWLTYTRKSHFPFWSSKGEVTLGTPPRK
jgi:hypothetical protein